MSDVGADACPIRREVVIANPTLQICRAARELECCAWGDDGLGRGEPQELSRGVQAHFGTKEIVVVSTDKERRREGDGELHLFTGYGAFASGELAGYRVDAVDHRVAGGKRGIQKIRREIKDSRIWIQIDETCDISGKFYLNFNIVKLVQI